MNHLDAEPVPLEARDHVDTHSVAVGTLPHPVPPPRRLNVLLPTVGSAGDVHPLLGLGQTLKARGHDVTILANPLFESLIREEGIGFSALGTREEAEQLMANPDLWHPQKSFATTMRYAVLPVMRRMYESIAQYDPATTVVGASGLSFGARLAQEKLGFPLATMHLSPSLLWSGHDAPTLGLKLPARLPPAIKRAWFRFVDWGIVGPALLSEINAFRRELALPPVGRIFGEWMHSPQQVIGLFPHWFAAPQPDWPQNTHVTGFMLYDAAQGQPLPPGVAAFLAAGEPPIIFTFGSAMQHGEPHFRAAIEATQRLGRRALLLTRDARQIPATLPDGIMHVSYLPFSAILPRAAAIVHHGGIGTAAQALAAGIPQLIMPMSHDQPDNATRLERLGVARSLPPSRFKGEAVARKLHHLLTSSDVHTKAAELARRVDAPRARAETALLLEQLHERVS